METVHANTREPLHSPAPYKDFLRLYSQSSHNASLISLLKSDAKIRTFSDAAKFIFIDFHFQHNI